MNSSLLKEDLLGLKSKLENIEKEFEEKLKDVEKKESKFKKLDEEIEELVKTKDSIIKLNIGGKIFQTKISTLLSLKDSLFYNLISKNMEAGKEMSKEIFFDRSYSNFPLILEYLRTKKFSLKEYGKYELEDIKAECEFYGLSQILEVIEEISKEIEFVSFEGAPQYSTAGTHRIEDLSDKSLTKGICVQTPYHFIITLNYEHEVDSIDYGGYNGNSGLWYVGNGIGAKILTSVDRANWREVGSIVSLDATIRNLKLTPSFAKYIKFQHTSYLGLGYLKLNRKV